MIQNNLVKNLQSYEEEHFTFNFKHYISFQANLYTFLMQWTIYKKAPVSKAKGFVLCHFRLQTQKFV